MTVLPLRAPALEDTPVDDDPEAAARAAHKQWARLAREEWTQLEARFATLLSRACPHLRMQLPSYRLTRSEVTSVITVLHLTHPTALIVGTPTIGELLSQYAKLHGIDPRARHHTPHL